ncbi:HK97-gp10 family putative phage morphogenesis protein [Xanthobacter wiegelii]|uniref:HK97-gp10 family putative phage morphogenesis protein n=1 Tax=Xanthobacter wiegelii TaxID=3119913 RepID=UPI00372A1110
MARSSGNGLAILNRRLKAIPKAAKEAVQPALLKAGKELSGDMKRLAERSRDTGDLIDSIAVTPAGQKTPPYSQPGGEQVVPENAVMVTAGNSSVRYAHLVEYGTTKAEAQPFFWPAVRLNRKKLTGRIKRAVSKAVKNAR